MTQDAQSPQEVDLYSPIDPASLPDDPGMLKQLLLQLLSLLRKETKRREDVERNMDLLLRKLNSSKSVPSGAGQQMLFDVTPEAADVRPPEPPPTPAAATKRKHTPHGRRKPPSHLEEIDVVHDLPSEVKQQLGEDHLVPLSDVVSFQYDYQAAKLVVLRHVQKKYVLRESASEETPSSNDSAQALPATPGAIDTESTDSPAAEPAQESGPSQRMTRNEFLAGLYPGKILLGSKIQALPGCEAAPGLLAFIWLSKFADHLPLYRLETITQRYGITFPRSTTCDWMLELGEVLRPLWEWMVREVLRSRVIHTDDTTVQLQDPDTGKMSKARFWNYIGDEEHSLTVLDFTLTHEREGPAAFLANYRGYLQADAYNGYDGLYLDSGGRIIEVGCWQHARKRYKEAAGSDVRASCAMAFIKSMYAVEDKIRQSCQGAWREMTLDERAARIIDVRQQETAPLLKSFRHWINHTIGDVLPKSDLADAFRYTLNQWEALNQFVSCGLLDIDNNPAERAHRGIAIGRKNWMHIGSERGGRAAAVHFSLIASCKMNGVEPYSYLVDVLNRLPSTAPEDLGQLSPNRWKPASTA